MCVALYEFQINLNTQENGLLHFRCDQKWHNLMVKNEGSYTPC